VKELDGRPVHRPQPIWPVRPPEGPIALAVPPAIAQLLGVDPATVRRWIHRYNHHGVAGMADRPAPAGRAWVAARSASASAGCWPKPARGRFRGCTSLLGRPAMPLRTLLGLVTPHDHGEERCQALLEQTVRFATKPSAGPCLSTPA
jgi:hypothetical protein